MSHWVGEGLLLAPSEWKTGPATHPGVRRTAPTTATARELETPCLTGRRGWRRSLQVYSAAGVCGVCGLRYAWKLVSLSVGRVGVGAGAAMPRDIIKASRGPPQDPPHRGV